jgi:hypothetical protein
MSGAGATEGDDGASHSPPRHLGTPPDNGWITLVMEQPHGTFVVWAGPGETIGVDYVEDTPEHAHAAAMFALKRKSRHVECSPRCSEFETRTHTMLVAASV